MVCLHSAPVRVPSRVPSPQSPLVGTHTLHCHSPQSDFFTFFSGFSFLPASAVPTAARMKMNARKTAANFRRCCRYCWDCILGINRDTEEGGVSLSQKGRLVEPEGLHFPLLEC
uniref:Uncharacterized protein n=1 Tax=Suricata suricatta TaxID=37032 RepID=A0A673T0X5_SURSU